MNKAVNPESIFSPAVGLRPKIRFSILEKSKAVGKNKHGKVIFFPKNNIYQHDRSKTSEQLSRYPNSKD